MYDPDVPELVPAWSDDLREQWMRDLVEVKDLNNPIYSLLMWRAEYGLEEIVASRRRLSMMPPPRREEYAMCSANTKNLVEIFTIYMSQYCCDDRPYNFYPLLDRIIEWMDTFYGTDTTA